jgi:hypothetical protein
MKPIGSIVNTVNANPAPVLFLDACILLDIVRAPLRNKASEVQFARVFLGSVQKTPKTVHLLIAPPIQTEWNDNIATTVNDCTTAVNGCNAVASICGHMALRDRLRTCGSGVTVVSRERQATFETQVA